MHYLLLESVTSHYADKLLLDEVDLGINEGQKVALIARNGTGKTTLLNIIAGKDVPEGGSVRRHPDIKIGYLSQEPTFDESLTLLEILFHDTENVMTRAIRQYELAVEQQAEDDNDANREAVQQAINEMELAKAWDYEAQVKVVLSKLQIDKLNRPVSTLSGGQKKRLALAQVLLRNPDFLILDEPTNHLDLHMIEWLEEYLKKPEFTLLLVTHDRYFLDRVTGTIVELEGGKLQAYRGNYTYYLRKKAELEEAQSREVEKAQSLMKKELEWIRRMPKARGTKNKARIDAFEDLRQKAGKEIKDDRPEFKVDTARLGNKIIDLKNVSKGFDDLKLIENFTYNFKRYEKVGIAGRNGSGKTTFLRLLTGELSPDSGTIKWGTTLQIGHFKQENPEQFYGKRAIDIVKEKAEIIELKSGYSMNAAQFMELFQFDGSEQFNYYETLSGGEKRRLHLVRVLMSNPNFLILDEPTNDLDLPTLQTLEQFLMDFPGCVVVVSHDRYFMDKVVDHMFIFKGQGQVIDYPGNYTQYREAEKLEERQAKKVQQQVKQQKRAGAKPKKEKTRLSYKEKFEYERLTAEIEQLEQRQQQLAAQLQAGGNDYEKIMDWSKELEEIQEALSQKEDRWLKLSEYEK